jgi:hypothetical protein
MAAGEPFMIPTDCFVNGRLSARTFTAPDGSITDNAVQSLANISASKLEHQHEPPVVLSNHATAVVVQRVPVYKCRGVTAVVHRFAISASVPPTGGGSVTVDLLKNGVSILSAPVVLDDTVAAYVDVVAIITSSDLVQGDQLDVSVTAVAATAPKGVAAWLMIRGKAQ